jgi:hypothetical protein
VDAGGREDSGKADDIRHHISGDNLIIYGYRCWKPQTLYVGIDSCCLSMIFVFKSPINFSTSFWLLFFTSPPKLQYLT